MTKNQKSKHIRIYFIDPTYGGDFPFRTSNGKITNYRKFLEEKYERKFKYENLGAGADLPSYFTTLKDWPYVIAAVAVFFSGKLLKDNIEAWIALAKSLRGYFKQRPIVEREAAALRAVDKIVSTKKLKLREFRLIAYSRAHIGDLLERKVRKPKCIAQNGLPIDLGHEFHNFIIEVNGKRHHVVVVRNKTEILR
jgi:hypothetical protein